MHVWRQSTDKGLSILEFLLLLGFGAILVGLLIVFVDPTNLKRKQRDVARLEALDDLNNALHLALLEGTIQFEDTKGCGTCTSSTGTLAVDGTGWVKYTLATQAGFGRYLDVLPKDPLNTEPYVFKFVSSSAQGYKLAVPLESAEYQVKMRVDGGIYPDLYEVGTDLSLEF